jgi:hypothetical protein
MQYQRHQNYREQLDSDGSRIFADTVIVQRTDVSVLDDVGRKELRTIGTGEAIVFYNGGMIRGTWKKKSATDRTRWYDAAGSEIPLKAGKIWIEVVGPGQQTVQWE